METELTGETRTAHPAGVVSVLLCSSDLHSATSLLVGMSSVPPGLLTL